MHTASFPYFSLLGGRRCSARSRRYRLVVDWHEVWTRAYWREYLGALRGAVGWRVQRLCLRIPQRAFCFSRLHERRLREEGFRGELTVLRGQYAGAPGGLVRGREPADGRLRRPPHPREARAGARSGDRAARASAMPDLRCEIFGDGPERPEVLRQVARGRPDGRGRRARASSRRSASRRRSRSALCLVLPSRREGYGLVVVEAASHGHAERRRRRTRTTPRSSSIEEGVNGAVAPSASPRDLADAVVRVHERGSSLRDSTAAWFAAHRRELDLATSLDRVVAAYDEAG